MNGMFELLKINLKLLLRNKGFLFFLCITPIVSVVILNIKTDSVLYNDKEAKSNIVELEKPSDRAVYVCDTSTFIVKVYDASQRELSEHMLGEIAKSGMFSVCRIDVRDMTEEEVLQQAKKDAFGDRAGALLYLKEGFEASVMAGDYAGAVQVYDVSDDERWELFEEKLLSLLTIYHQTAKGEGMDSDKILHLLQSLDNEVPKKETIGFSGKDAIVLTDRQVSQKTCIGYALAIITLGFLFCGVCVAYTVIQEQGNKVYTRILLSKVGRREYLCSKFIMAVFISVMQTFLLGLCIFTLKNMDFGIDKLSFLFLIFLLGLIFCAASLMIGILLGDVMSANYAVFTLWSVSALLSGLYFPLDATSQALRTISFLMPQRWFLRAAELLFAGDKNVYSMVIYITAAYLIVIMSIGCIGLKMKRTDS